ncbi:hypothetical protein ACC754_41065, partial [Rhizobium johnstonii]
MGDVVGDDHLLHHRAADLKKQLDDARNELAIAQRKGEFQRAGELTYGVITDLEKQLVDDEKQDGDRGAM